ncbi:Ig-like domain-containing protein [Isobaculum melis]|uniref:Bacterial Ig domain-containing protein n=1 Tax=Isobaculum melis TaxID=142588 RepID=A0A1H9PUQ5_9LACT|nr:Ig-like domain-containing protein [Isobaculum melis]SER51519.1 hypothetical protein SAMN04488559_101128 [Isobaculum melis]
MKKKRYLAAVILCSTIFSSFSPLVAQASEKKSEPFVLASSADQANELDELFHPRMVLPKIETEANLDMNSAGFEMQARCWWIKPPVFTVSAPQVNTYKASDTYLTGYARPNALVYARFGNSYTAYSGYASATGYFSIKIGAQKYTAGTRIQTQQYYAHTPSPWTTTTVQAGIPVPSLTQPQLDAVYNDHQVVSGKANPNCEVIVTIKGVQYKGKTNSNGDFLVTLSRTYETGTKVSAHTVKGNLQSPQGTTYVQARHVAPCKPTIEAVYDDQTVVTGKADGTKKVMLTIAGDRYVGYADSNGDYTIQLTKTYAAGTEITAYSEDNGLKSELEKTVVLKRAVELTKPKINDVTEDSLVVSGVTTPNMSIRFIIGADVYQAVSGNDGSFTIQLDSTYRKGTLIETYAYDGRGNRSDSLHTSVILGTIKLGVNQTFSRDTIITGQTNPGMDIEVIIGNRVYTGVANSDGSYEVSFSRAYPAGTNVLVKVSDRATGKSSQKYILVNPFAPSINQVLVGAKEVTGQADPHASIVVVLSGREYHGTADSAGNYIVNVSETDAFKGNQVIVHQVSNGIESNDSIIYID